MLCKEMMQESKQRTQATPRRICFVCTGNTCRSPMAAAVANALASERDGEKPSLIATSAGLYAGEGEPITPVAVVALEHAGVRAVEGVDYHAHIAHTVTEADVDAADLLVAVSGSHAMELLFRFPAAAHKIVCMPQAISDPFGGDLARYEACLREITAGVKTLLFEEATQ